jgi:hypothetical protein
MKQPMQVRSTTNCSWLFLSLSPWCSLNALMQAGQMLCRVHCRATSLSMTRRKAMWHNMHQPFSRFSGVQDRCLEDNFLEGFIVTLLTLAEDGWMSSRTLDRPG